MLVCVSFMFDVFTRYDGWREKMASGWPTGFRVMVMVHWVPVAVSVCPFAMRVCFVSFGFGPFTL